MCLLDSLLHGWGLATLSKDETETLQPSLLYFSQSAGSDLLLFHLILKFTEISVQLVNTNAHKRPDFSSTFVTAHTEDTARR